MDLWGVVTIAYTMYLVKSFIKYNDDDLEYILRKLLFKARLVSATMYYLIYWIIVYNSKGAYL